MAMRFSSSESAHRTLEGDDFCCKERAALICSGVALLISVAALAVGEDKTPSFSKNENVDAGAIIKIFLRFLSLMRADGCKPPAIPTPSSLLSKMRSSQSFVSASELAWYSVFMRCKGMIGGFDTWTWLWAIKEESTIWMTKKRTVGTMVNIIIAMEAHGSF